MSSFKSRARRLAFGDSNENLSDASSACSSIRSRSSSSKTHGIFRHTSSMSEACSCHTTEKRTYVAPKRTNKVQRIGRRQAFERFVEALEADGCVIVEDFVSSQISQRVSTAENMTLEPNDDEQIPQQAAIDINALIRESLLSDSLYQTLSRHFLSLETVSWHHKQAEMKTLRPAVSSSSTTDLTHQYLSVDDDQSADFHRADSIYHNRHPASSKYEYQSRRDVSLGLYVPELDSLSASVPVKVVPGSHLWDDQKPDLAKGVKDIHLHGGDALILLGSLYHQTGPPKIERLIVAGTDSGTPTEKLMHQIWMCSGIYRPVDDLHDDDEA